MPESAVPPARPTPNVGSLAVAAAGGVDREAHEAALAQAVARAVAEERARWQTVQQAVQEVQQARQTDDALTSSRAQREAMAQEQLRNSERAREAATREAAQLADALRQAEAQLRELKADAAGGFGGGGMRRPGTAESAAETPRSQAGGGGQGSAYAVERWEAEKKLQRKVDAMKQRLQDKGAELAAAEAELAKARNQLDEASRREEKTRELLRAAQDAATRQQKDEKERLSGAMSEMRTREQLSAELYAAQQALAAARAAPPPAPVPAPPVGGSASEVELRGLLLEREQKVMEQSFTLEQQEVTIAQLQGRLRDLSAYQSVLGGGGAGGAGGAGLAQSSGRSPPKAAAAAGRGRGGSAGGGAGREELNAVVERMQRVIEKLQGENATLQKRAVSNVRYMELTKEAKEMRQQLDAAAQETRAADARAAGLRDEAARAGRAIREAAEAKQALKAEADRGATLKQRLAEARQAQAEAEEQLLTLSRRTQPPPQWDRLKRELDAKLDAAAEREALLRQEAASKGSRLARLEQQLQAAERRGPQREQLAGRIDALERSNAALQQERDGLAVALARQACEPASGGAGAGSSSGGAELQQLQQSYAALERERNQLAEELRPFTRSFFEEIEDLKFNHATALQQLEAYASRFGSLG